MECLFNKICWSLEHPDPSAEALNAEQLLRQGMWNTLLGDLDDPIGAFMNGGRSIVLHTLAAAFCSFLASVSRQSRADLHKSDQRCTQRADELRQQAQDLSTSVDDLHAPRRVVHDVVQEDFQRLDAESNELSQWQKQLHMRTEVAADDLGPGPLGPEEPRKVGPEGGHQFRRTSRGEVPRERSCTSFVVNLQNMRSRCWGCSPTKRRANGRQHETADGQEVHG